LPAEDWEFAEWRRARVNLDYHIEVHDFLYSVPHALIRAEVEVRVTARTDNGGLRYGAWRARYARRYPPPPNPPFTTRPSFSAFAGPKSALA
jgi:hypothetical protein